MKPIPVLILCLVCAFMAASCDTVPPSDEMQDLEITLTRGACLGICPVYTLTIRADGTVTFDGRAHTETKGTATSMLDKSKLEELATYIKEADFFSLDSYYPADLTDQGSYTLTVRLEGQNKQVRSEGRKGPARLHLLRIRIEKIANTDQWIGNWLDNPN